MCGITKVISLVVEYNVRQADCSYITHNATQPLSDNLSDYMQLPLEPQKAFYYSFSHHGEVLHKSCEHSLICQCVKLVMAVVTE